MKRTIYPVGQGAFFVENLYSYTFIYDCGSTYTATARDNAISQLCTSITGNVTGMFISHFHADHINGIEKLIQELKRQGKMIERIFFPKITDANKIESLLSLATLDEDYIDFANIIRFINDPKTYLTDPETGFNNIKIIEVEDEETKQNLDINNIEIPINLLGITSRRINSSTKLEININHSGIQYNWQYIPFNYAPYTATQIANFMSSNGFTNIELTH